MKDLVKKLEGMSLTITNDKINQTQRNAIKDDLIVALGNTFSEIEGVETFRTKDGVILPLAVGREVIYVAVDPVIKNMDYDLDFEIGEYEQKVAERLERERKLAEKRAEKTKNKKTE